MDIKETVKTGTEAIARAYTLEFNSPALRRDFVRNLGEWLNALPIQQAKVVCDESNNTPEDVDNGRFNADIYFKPFEAQEFVHLKMAVVPSQKLIRDVVCEESH